MLRVTKDRKRKYSSIGISVNPVYWDFVKNKPKRNCPNKVKIERLIAEKIRLCREQMIDFQTENKDFTATSLVEKIQSPLKVCTVGEMFLTQITRLKKQRRIGYALSHTEVYNSLIKFNGTLDLYFSDLTVVWLKSYENWLRENNYSENTMDVDLARFEP